MPTKECIQDGGDPPPQNKVRVSMVLPTYLPSDVNTSSAKALCCEENSSDPDTEEAEKLHNSENMVPEEVHESENSFKKKEMTSGLKNKRLCESQSPLAKKIKNSSKTVLKVQCQPVASSSKISQTTVAHKGVSYCESSDFKGLMQFWNLRNKGTEPVTSSSVKADMKSTPLNLKITQKDTSVSSEHVEQIKTKPVKELIAQYSSLISDMNKSNQHDKLAERGTNTKVNTSKQESKRSVCLDLSNESVRVSASSPRDAVQPNATNSTQSLTTEMDHDQSSTEISWVKTPCTEKSDHSLVEKTPDSRKKRNKNTGKSQNNDLFSPEALTSPESANGKVTGKQRSRRLMSLDPFVYSQLLSPPSQISLNETFHCQREKLDGTEVWTDSDEENVNVVRKLELEDKSFVRICQVSPVCDNENSTPQHKCDVNDLSNASLNSSVATPDSLADKSLIKQKVNEAIHGTVNKFLDFSDTDNSFTEESGKREEVLNKTAECINESGFVVDEVKDTVVNTEAITENIELVDETRVGCMFPEPCEPELGEFTLDSIEATTERDVLLLDVSNNEDYYSETENLNENGVEYEYIIQLDQLSSEDKSDNENDSEDPSVVTDLSDITRILPGMNQLIVVEVNDEVQYSPASDIADLDAAKFDCSNSEFFEQHRPETSVSPTVMADKELGSLTIEISEDTKIAHSDSLLQVVEDQNVNEIAKEVEAMKQPGVRPSADVFDPCFSPDLTCHESLSSSTEALPQAKDLLLWSPIFNVTNNTDEIIPPFGRESSNPVVKRNRGQCKRPRKLDFDEKDEENYCSSPKLPKTPMTEQQFAFPPSSDDENSGHVENEINSVHINQTDESYGDEMNGNSDNEIVGLTSLGNQAMDLIDQLELPVNEIAFCDKQINLEMASVAETSGSNTSNSDLNETWPTLPQFPPIYSQTPEAVTSLLNDGFCGSPHVAVLTSDSAVEWKEFSIGSFTYSPEPSIEATEYASHCYNMATSEQEYHPCLSSTLNYDHDEVPVLDGDGYTQEVDVPVNEPLYSAVKINEPMETYLENSGLEQELNKGFLEDTSSGSSQSYDSERNSCIYTHGSRYHSSEESKAVRDNKSQQTSANDASSCLSKQNSESSNAAQQEYSGVNNAFQQDISPETESPEESMVSMIESKVRQKLQEQITKRRKSLSDTELLEKIQWIRPYIISGWLSTTYLMALVKKTDLINDMFEDPLDENDTIKEWIVQSCSMSRPEVLARDLLFRLFTLKDLQTLSFIDLARFKTYRAIKLAVIKHFKGKMTSSKWKTTCVPFMRSSVDTLFKNRVKVVQNFFLLHAA